MRRNSIFQTVCCLVFVQFFALGSSVYGKDCKASALERPYQKTEVYSATPYKQGEVSKYKVHYGFIYVGNGTVTVNPPFQYQGNWRQVFDAEGKTGSWYSFVFSGHDRMRVISSAESSSALWAYVDQDEHQVGANPYIKQKTMTFNQSDCRVETKSFRNNDKSKLKTKVHPYDSRATDTLSAVFAMRKKTNFVINKKIKFPVFSSGKSWHLEATPIGYEKIKVKGLGAQRCLKLKIKTYMGSHLQQKGDMFAWISEDHPSRPLVRATGDLKIGKIKIELTDFQPGR